MSVINHRTRLLIFVIPFIGFSCKQRSNESRVKADYVDTKPVNGDTWTESRTIALNNYAADLLNYKGNERKKHNELQLQVDESFKAAGVTDAPPLSTYILKLGPLDECYGESRNDYSLWWDSHKEQIKEQIEQAAYFIRDFHLKMLGQTKGAFSFREVIICPEAKTGAKMRLDGYQLRIGVPYTSFGNYKPIPNNAANGEVSLNSLWQMGAPVGLDQFDKSWWSDLKAIFDKKEKAQRALGSVWQMLNPLSTVRVSIRKILHESGTDIKSRISSILKSVGNNSAGLRAGLVDELIGSDIISSKSIDQKQLPEDVMQIFSNLDDDGLVLLAKNWSCIATNTERRNEVESEATSVMQREMRSEKNYIKKDVRAGLVAVVNHHRIGVNIQAGSGIFSRYMPVETARETRITTKVTAGLVAVDTSDDISVELNFGINLGKTMPTIAFELAVRAAASKRNLCN